MAQGEARTVNREVYLDVLRDRALTGELTDAKRLSPAQALSLRRPKFWS